MRARRGRARPRRRCQRSYTRSRSYTSGHRSGLRIRDSGVRLRGESGDHPLLRCPRPALPLGSIARSGGVRCSPLRVSTGCAARMRFAITTARGAGRRKLPSPLRWPWRASTMSRERASYRLNNAGYRRSWTSQRRQVRRICRSRPRRQVRPCERRQQIPRAAKAHIAGRQPDKRANFGQISSPHGFQPEPGSMQGMQGKPTRPSARKARGPASLA